MEIITYSLKAGEKSSDRFYNALEKFTSVVLSEGEVRLGALVEAYQASGTEPDMTCPELLFDLLTIGVLWAENGRDAVSLGGTAQRFLSALVWVRRNIPVLKSFADLLRGVVGRIAGIKRDGTGELQALTLENLERLIDWLDAAGDFKEETRRIRIWADYLKGRPEAQDDLGAVSEYADWFEEASRKVLGAYTPEVENFLADIHPGYRGREDYTFTGRGRTAYHLYMVGAEIMNQAYLDAFRHTKKRILFVPPCMAAPKDGKCQAKDTPLGSRCAACTPSCQVHQATQLGKQMGVEVFMIPDSFSPLSGGGDGVAAEVGVVGVSCPVTITGGGWEMRRMGIPAQGLLLDHCGCSWHWDPGRGIVTEINFRELKRILGEGE